jgi:integrase
MPRKPAPPTKFAITVVVDGKPIKVTLYPPTGTGAGQRASWFVYWTGLTASKSTGQADREEAIKLAESMAKNHGRRPVLSDTVLTDEEFHEIQKRHFAKKKNQKAAKQTLYSCQSAIDAFKYVSGLPHITLATAAECEAFMWNAQKLPKNWKAVKEHNEQPAAKPISEETVIKWLRSLAAAWNRANSHAGRKCVRGVVVEKKLLTSNPWVEFTWIETKEKPIRQFDADELLSILDYLEAGWPDVSTATALAKVCLWSWGRRAEIVGLTWSTLREVGEEKHFEILGKAGVKKWCQLPEALYKELLAFRTNSPYVFAAHNEQLRQHHLKSKEPWRAKSVAPDYQPNTFWDWFHDRVTGWSATMAKAHAYPHIFRKTTMQYAHEGAAFNQEVARNLRVSPTVMMNHYVEKTDLQRRQESNITFKNIHASLPPEVAARYGHTEPVSDPLREQLDAAVAAGDWPRVAELANQQTARASPDKDTRP